MIRSKDLNAEIKILDDIADVKVTPDVDEMTLFRGIVKGIALTLKVMRDIKTNQVKYLRHLGVELNSPREDGKTKRSEKKGFNNKVLE